jgi:hypothetical protein
MLWSMKNLFGGASRLYHPIGQSKSERIGKAAPMEDATFASWEAAVAAATHVPVKKGS